MKVSVSEGKYTVVQDDEGLRALRYGEPWRDCVGDNLIYSLAAELEATREAVMAAAEYIGDRSCGSTAFWDLYDELNLNNDQ